MGIKSRLSGCTGSYVLVKRRWPAKARRAIAWLMAFELLGLIPALVIFGIAQPNLYRTDLWRIGFDNKLNSNPNMILYAYANHRPQPHIPFVWSQTLTNFNVAISVISLFFLLSRLICFIMKIWVPLVALIVQLSLVALYLTSTVGQIGPDHADKRYPAYAAWYFRKGCGLAKPYGKYKNCQIAQGSLAITLYMLTIYRNNQIEDPDDEDRDSLQEVSVGYDSSGPIKPRIVEMRSLHTPGFAAVDSPFTPRTTAFHTLNRTDLSLRNQYA
ncbi:hypothetical protein NLU13_8102 [Sarocladium strictum]|uniref:Uncharacterized protein n=1 Tax=Sarocladium strictum TaxID=5046 RepID=A0AA39GC58_SARSR|nr:hypothetical protein NLU13_8102 [Sarocladium strictum]